MLNTLLESPLQSGTAPDTSDGELQCDILQKPDNCRMGYGACSISGCPCRGFREMYGSDLCGNCGHKYTDHY